MRYLCDKKDIAYNIPMMRYLFLSHAISHLSRIQMVVTSLFRRLRLHTARDPARCWPGPGPSARGDGSGPFGPGLGPSARGESKPIRGGLDRPARGSSFGSSFSVESNTDPTPRTLHNYSNTVKCRAHSYAKRVKCRAHSYAKRGKRLQQACRVVAENHIVKPRAV